MTLYLNKITAYYTLNRNSEALKLLEVCELMPGMSKEEKINISLSKCLVYSRINDNEKAEIIYNQFFNSSIPESIKIKILVQYASYLYIRHARIDEAIEIYNYLESFCNNSALTKFEMLQVYNNLGNCYETKKLYKETLDTYQKALHYLYPGFTNTEIKFNPPPGLLYEEAQNITLFSNKAEVLFKYSIALKDTSYLIPSLNNSLRSIDIIQKMRYRISSDQSQFLISKKERTTFNLAQYIALENYIQTKDNKYLNTAFQVNEMGRSFTLLSAMRNQKAINFGNVPDKVRKQESDLNWQISFYDELIYKEKRMETPDLAKISGWEDELFNANSKYTSLLKRLERDYPEYFRLKYDEKVTDIFDVQKKIEKNTVLLEYAYFDTVLIIYTASREKVDAIRVKIQPGFEDKCIEFLHLITTQNFSKSVGSTFNTYTKLAYELYSILIDPVKDQLTGSNLIIIPDGALSYLPFDALLTAYVPPSEKPDYRHIPYLIKDYSVGYSYSTTLHFNPLQHVRIPSESILAFAPIYSKPPPKDQGQYVLRKQEFLDLVMLPGVTIEVNNISGMFKTNAYYNVGAKESVFKEMAGRYKILHLAMHTLIDNNDPMLSKLVFTQIPDGEEDGLLHTYEIYNMKLNANMTVLSSCSSGYGKVQPGEGVQSLARGFAYAGCPSILMTLWEVADFSTVLLMTDFYKSLREHRTKPQALREAKINFLDDSDELRSNPYFWASYVIIGDSSPIYPLRTDLAALNALMLLLPLGFLGIYFKKYKKEVEEEEKTAA